MSECVPVAWCDRCGATEYVASWDGAILIEEIRRLKMEGWDCEDSREWLCPACVQLRRSQSEKPLPDRLFQQVEAAWGIIANVSGGDWTKQSPEWQEAARRWEREYAGGQR